MSTFLSHPRATPTSMIVNQATWSVGVLMLLSAMGLAYTENLQVPASVASCCTCHGCDGCLQVRGVGKSRRLKQVVKLPVDCCTICGRRAMPARSPLPRIRAAHPMLEARTQSSASRAAMLVTQAATAPEAKGQRQSTKKSKKVKGVGARLKVTLESRKEKFFAPTFEEKETDFALVLVKSQPARKISIALINQMTSPFGPKSKFGAATADYWHLWKKELGCNSAPKRILAMGRNNAPCAAASITRQPFGADAGATILEAIIRSSEENCKGSAAKIVCHLIADSKGLGYEPAFKPLRLVPTNSATRTYFETFGCRDIGGSEMVCEDQYPARCENYGRTRAIDADRFFEEEIAATYGTQVSHDLLSTTGLTLVGLFAGSALMFTMLRCRHGIVTMGTDVFLAA